ncbi:hypothetical protein BDZ89DRAFT_1079975 [Hymenopellis radicata]|nr:hypothetical protein BDZ89DRAFT_1079975 [Hymenopellis radicata]
MSASKPLPAIPLSHPLSNEGKYHRRKVVKALLGILNAEEDKPDDDWEDLGMKDGGLVGQIEKALDTSSDIRPLLPSTASVAQIIYTQRSLAVEETFLRECGVPMAYPRPKVKAKHSSSASMTSSPTIAEEGTMNSSKRNTFIPSSILSFFSKKSLSSSFSIREYASSPRSSSDSPTSYTRSRRFSLLPQLHHRESLQQREPEAFPVSTSPGVEFPSVPSSSADFLRNQAICVLVDSCKTETLRYYGKGDTRLETMIRTLEVDREWVHAGVRVRANVALEPGTPAKADANTSALDDASTTADSDPSSEPVVHVHSTHPLTPLLSFGKFLELVIYSPRMKSFLDAHPNSLKFKVGNRKQVTFTVERDLRVYNLCAPRIQPNPATPSLDQVPPDADKLTLRREIRAWWEGVGLRLDEIEEHIEDAAHPKKRLPRLPSEWVDDSTDLPVSPPSPTTSSSFSATSEKPDIPVLRESFHAIEHGLYAQLGKCSSEELNGVRRAFLRAAREVEDVLGELKDDEEKAGDTVKRKDGAEAATVKSKEAGDTVKGKQPSDAQDTTPIDFPSQEEQEPLTPNWWSKSSHVPPSGNVIVREDDWGSIIAFSMSTPEYRASLTSPPSADEPLLSPSLSNDTNSSGRDDEFSAVISRKENPSQAGMLEVLKDRGSKFGSLRLPGMKIRDLRASETSTGTGTAPSSWGKASMDGKALGGSLLKAEVNSLRAEVGSINSDIGSFYATSEAGSEDTVGPELPPKDFCVPIGESTPDECAPPTPSKSTIRSAFGIDRWLFPQSPLGRPTVEARPHIKYDFTVSQGPMPSDYPNPPSNPRRLKFSSTIYYASSFDTLRSKCSVSHASFIKSLSQLVPFKAEGGKSSSGFWRSADGRWLVKTLVNKWGVADLSVLLAMSPRYFDWVLRDGGEKGGMVKFMGFYTVEVRNLDTGVGEKVDLLVMENLFWGGRRVKKKEKEKEKEKEGEKAAEPPLSGVLFDAEWLQGPLTLVAPKSKALLKAAVCADAGWLAKSNIMDYSLLLGVDNEKGEIVGGIVDTIGSYTFAKTLEYNLKANAARKPEEVTVVPPTEYQDRFVTAMGKYFTECPDMQSLPELEADQTEWEVPEVL